MSLLPEPYNYIDLAHNDSMTLNVHMWQDGEATIHPTVVTQRHVRQHMEQNGLTAPPPAGTPITITTPVLRLHAARVDQPSNAAYFDLSSKTARADLLARLQHGATLPLRITLLAQGVKPQKRYSITVGPGEHS